MYRGFVLLAKVVFELLEVFPPPDTHPLATDRQEMIDAEHQDRKDEFHQRAPLPYPAPSPVGGGSTQASMGEELGQWQVVLDAPSKDCGTVTRGTCAS